MSTSTVERITFNNWEFLFQEGNLRFICFKGYGILSAINFPVRDANWNTVPQTVKNIRQETVEDRLKLTFDVFCVSDEIDFRWECACSLKADALLFSIRGKAFTSFERNRIGLCVLHSIDCKAKKIEIGHTDGKRSHAKFPKYISPHQPFKDIKSMQWQCGPLTAHLTFSGAVFETEDQRNWSDASFKTYCTPLDLPFPVTIKIGDEVQQSMTLRIQDKNSVHAIQNEAFVLESFDKINRIPAVGLESNTDALDEFALSRLKELNLSHIRVEAPLHQMDWEITFRKKLQQAQMLKCALELVIFLSEKEQDQLQRLYDEFPKTVVIKTLLVLEPGGNTASPKFLSRVIPHLRKLFPNTPIGSGTDYNFAEINRSRPDMNLLDFISFSMNPQVHAFDNLTLLENTQSLPDMLLTAKRIAKEKPIVISPITLKPRSNPVAKKEVSQKKRLEQRLDQRHTRNFNALWTFACLKQLAQTEAEQLTFFQTIGQQGLVDSQGQSSWSESSNQLPTIFPVYYVFKKLAEFKNGMVIRTKSSHPLVFDGLLLQNEKKKLLLMANYSDKELLFTFKDSTYKVPSECLRPFHIDQL